MIMVVDEEMNDRSLRRWDEDQLEWGEEFYFHKVHYMYKKIYFDVENGMQHIMA